ncbi:glycosyltransferase [Conexibacter stalactiti]|uniref:Glycosyltransferase n=1 Tax=Conexibacter stalactiti TaxID=1940611 RepID=A0ABU4HLC9_9ACTN|nr:glycosyltransferase [Conexibacter stalactiti]MDW5593519.1 glycosyltransferase [Conexibacter stalactiti]MEC5034160.1 glycosyltransferase [Conexibacter stalactiti]
MRIAYLADPGTGNGFYRGIAPMMVLGLRGHRMTRLSTDERRPPLGQMTGIDVLHLHRYCDDRALALARAAKAGGAAVVWDNDDDMGSVPKDSNAYRKFGGIQWQRRLTAMRRLFPLVDLVTSTNETLAGRLREAGAQRTDTVENYVPQQFLVERRRPQSGVTIGWIAGLEHQLDVERMPLREALSRLLDERPEVRVRTFGLKLGLNHEHSTNVDVVPLLELTQEATSFDIGIAPLSDIPLNRARSNIKLKEYAAAGLPWLASPIGPYAGMGEQQGGRLVPDDGWYEALVRLVDKERERRKLAKRARKWVEGETLERNAQRWEQLLTDAVERSRAAR